MDTLDDVQLLVGIKASVAYHFADYVPVLLLHVAGVVLLVGTTTGEGDRVPLAVTFEVSVDELAFVVRVDTEDRER